MLHFKRNFKSGAAADARRRRAGRFGKRIGMSDSDEDSQASDEPSSDEDYDDDDQQCDDDFFRYDAEGHRVSGRYTTEGYFMVEVRDRDVRGRCDNAGFMLDDYGSRV